MTLCASLGIVASLRSVDEVGGAGERGAERCGFGSGQEGQLVVLAADNGSCTVPGSVTEPVVASTLSVRLMSTRRGFGVISG
jgi:hypothetical protein